ncbi:MAG: hypothetical protein EMLJLAPB_00932 [Candidatus Argoarchaeum ethanivorans]|uniref:DUF454 domain-containing protein n=1 Tax=Candidatus Argoarchaeum ethanivorans TaxID=2608793 RepID=A0A811TFU2_9EURY|nr:MAG: hypothetical protein EMLJLAPB_00932 [Candidatus Argoarchaeum ethanivorans]
MAFAVVKKNGCDDSSNWLTRLSKGLVKKLLVAAGTFFVVLAIVGIFLPVLPTVPFLLLASTCYAKSSKRFYNWLLNNNWFGVYVKNYRKGEGIPLKMKALSIFSLWATIIFSAVFVVHILFVRIILILIAIVVTIHTLHIRTLKQQTG